MQEKQGKDVSEVTDGDTWVDLFVPEVPAEDQPTDRIVVRAEVIDLSDEKPKSP